MGDGKKGDAEWEYRAGLQERPRRLWGLPAGRGHDEGSWTLGHGRQGGGAGNPCLVGAP